MFEPLIQLAVSKTSSPAERAALQAVLEAAVALDNEERTFGARVDVNKALRGEAPTKLSKRKKAEIDGYAADASEMEAQQLKEFAEFDSGSSIISCLHMALGPDVKLWQSAHTKAHPADAFLIQEFSAAKLELLEAMGTYLSEFPRDES